MTPHVRDFVWRDATPLTGEAATRTAATAPETVLGQFAVQYAQPDGGCLLARDQLGVNKLFFAIGDDGRLETSHSLFVLRRRGFPLARIWSVPSAHQLEIDVAARRLSLRRYLPNPFDGDGVDDLDRLADLIRSSLEHAFDLLRPVAGGRPLYVTMSGGLDSSTIAALARERLGGFTGVTFATGSAGPASDLAAARRLAAELGIPLLEVAVPARRIGEKLDDVLVHGQDWRDFNVHCGLVNAWLAEAIAADAAGRGRPLVLTGDTMNEMMADYAAVEYRGNRYYELPELPPGRLRRFLVGGLDSGDREIGIFAAAGIDTIQPFAMCAQAYARIPAGYVGTPGAKSELVQRVLGSRVPAFVHERPKVRAQVGDAGEVGGTLAALVDQGIDSTYLARRFAELLGVQPRQLGVLIRAGYYRFPTTYPR
jgi:asparagine synthetase B (glutamine-hydrolysing)